MSLARDKYIWLTDTHVYPWNRYKLLSTILDQKPKAVFLTGDLSNSSQTLIDDLDFLGSRIGRPFYFILGNHDFHFSSIEETHSNIRKVCQKHKNIVWIDEAGIIPLTDEVCCIGNMGWYDARHGNTEYLKYTFDWFLIKEFKELPSMKHRIEMFRSLAEDSAKKIVLKLEGAIETYKTVYLLTHFPPYREADRYHSWISETFWEPYNTNITMGKAIDKVMETNKKRNVIVLSGHTHSPMQIHVSRNIECRVGKGSYHKLSDEEIIFI
jgi:UDP-2,3-diacylglucosamine pyrophosphatase LpxH